MFLPDVLQSLTERCLVYRWDKCCDIIDGPCLWIAIPIDSAPISSALDLVLLAVEPHDGIQSTWNHALGRLLLGLGLYQHEGFLHLHLSLDWVQLLLWLVTAQSLL